MMIMVATAVMGEKTVKTVELPIGYVATASANTNYMTSITVDMPDGISQILSLEIMVKGDFQASTGVKGRYQNSGIQDCNPATWTTPNIDAPDYNIIFDCTDEIGNWLGGTKNFGFRLDKVAKNVAGKVKITYLNDPPIQAMSVGGTEYSADETARMVMHILDNNNAPLNDVSCYITVRDSEDTIYVNNQTLSYISSSNGLYSYQFGTNLPFGVYSTDAVCQYNGSTVYTADTFHVAKWTDHLDETQDTYEVKRVSGTWYDINETATISVQVLQNGVPDTTSQCFIDIYEPDSPQTTTHTKVVDAQIMTLLPNSNGIYTYYYPQTDKIGLYLSDVTCSDSGIGEVPVGYQNAVTDSTTSQTLTEISGSQTNITTTLDVPIVAVMSVEGYITGGSSGEATYGLKIDSKTSTIQQGFSGANEEGNILVALINSNVTAGQHTITAYHNITTGETINSKINLFGIGLEDGTDAVDYCYSEIDTDTVVGSSLKDIDGLTCDIDLPQASDLTIIFLFSGTASIDDTDISYTVSIDGIDQELHTRTIDDADTYSALSFMTVSNDQLDGGSHEIKGRWKTSKGTGSGNDFALIVISNNAGTRQFDMEENELSSAETSSQTSVPIGIPVSVRLFSDHHIVGMLSLQTETTSANKHGNYANNIDGTDKEFFTRFFDSGNKQGSVAVVEMSDELTIGYHTPEPKWYTDHANTLRGNQIKYIGFGLTTASPFAPVYEGLDFQVVNRSTWGNDIFGNETLSKVWNYDNRTLTGSEHLWIGGTEYSPDEETGKAIVRLVDNTDTPVETADCILRVAYPNNTINFVQNMTHINGTVMGGLYVADFTLPNEAGVYPYGVDCEVTGGASPKNYYLLDTFHIFGANETKRAELFWNYTDRTLTQNLTAQINETAITESVWAWNNIGQNIIDYLLTQFQVAMSHVTG